MTGPSLYSKREPKRRFSKVRLEQMPQLCHHIRECCCRQATYTFNYQLTMQCNEFAQLQNRRFRKATGCQIGCRDLKLVGCESIWDLRGNCRYKQIVTNRIKRVSRDDHSRPLLSAAQIGEWKMDQNDVTPFIAHRKRRRQGCSRIQMQVRQVSTMSNPPAPLSSAAEGSAINGSGPLAPVFQWPH